MLSICLSACQDQLFCLVHVLIIINAVFQEKACEDIDMTDIGPPSLDSKKSRAAKMDKFREEAHHEKERVREKLNKQRH